MLALSMLIALAGCKTTTVIKIQSDPQSESTIQSYGTYAWILEDASRHGKTRLYEMEDLDEVLTSVIDSYLGELGYQKTESPESDMLLVYHVGLIDNTVDHLVGDAELRSLEWERDPFDSKDLERNFERGSLLLEVIETDTNSVLWRGAVAMRINPDDSVRKRRFNAVDRIADLLDTFPVKN